MDVNGVKMEYDAWMDDDTTRNGVKGHIYIERDIRELTVTHKVTKAQKYR